MMPTDTEIHYFIQVYHLKHFTEAARSLRISQSALTQSIAKLEQKLKAPLFHRSKRGISVTPAGELFYRHAQELRENWSRVAEALLQDQTTLTGRFRIGCHPSLGVYALPSFMKQVAQAAPQIELHLVHDYSKVLVEKVLSYELDLAFVVNPARHPDLVLNPVFQDEIGLWKAKKGMVTEQILTDMNVEERRRLLKKHAFHDWKVVESTSLELIRALTAEGLGVGILPERVAKLESRIERYDSKVLVQDQIDVIYRKDTLKTEAGRFIRNTVRSMR